MKVEIWSDVACPWCYIGKRRFERALDVWDGAPEVEVAWRSFQLDPTIPPGTRRPHDEAMAEKFGVTVAQMRAMNERLVGLAAAEGLAYDFGRHMIVNTRDAHRLAHLASAHGLGPAMQERLMAAQHIEGEILDDHETLVRLGASVGVPEDEARRVLASDAFGAEVDDDIREARMLGANGVPFFVIDRRFGISGAQPSELFRDALEQARAEVGTAAT